MSIVIIHYDFYNRQNPKCRACKLWETDEGRKFSYYGTCTSETTKIKFKNNRAGNAKACTSFEVASGL